MMVNIYGGDIQVQSPMDSSEDDAASDILRNYHPVTLRMFSPRAVVGDGNCCYRAVSLAMYGDQRHHLHVRLLAAVEIIKHPEEYDVSDQDYVGQIDVSTVYVAPYNELLDAVTTNGGFAELMHIVAISAALGELLSNRCRDNGH